MPNPTEYEKLVKTLIETKLDKGYNNFDFQVFHNKHYVGKSGHNHQIDVSVEFLLAGTKIIILVECKTYSRKVGINDLLEFVTRLEDIGAHKGICVTTVGFQVGAIAIAKSKGVALVKACDLGAEWGIINESPICKIIRHETFVENAKIFLSWFLPDIINDLYRAEALEEISRFDVTSPLGVVTAPFGSLSYKSPRGGLCLAGIFAPDHAFIVFGENTNIILGANGLWNLVLLTIRFEWDSGSNLTT